MNEREQGEKVNSKRRQYEVNEDLSSPGTLASLTCPFRFLLVALFKPVHEQAIPGGTQHSKELSDGKGICVGADCKEQRGLG